MAADLSCSYMAADLSCSYMAADLLCSYMAAEQSGRGRHPGEHKPRTPQWVSTNPLACSVTSRPEAVTLAAVIWTPVGSPGSFTENTA
jgi:hypothetical protein